MFALFRVLYVVWKLRKALKGQKVPDLRTNVPVILDLLKK